jgi:hypothetical protein
MAQVVGDLTVEGRLQHAFGQLLQQPTVASQRQARGAGLLHQPADQLGVHTAHRPLGRIVPVRHRGSIRTS